MIAAPAHVKAHRLLRNIPQGIVEGLDAHPGKLAIFRNAHITLDLPGVRQVRIVNLEREAGVGDSLVLLVHGISDSVEEFLVAAVILVFHPMLDGPWCHGRQKGFATLHTLESGLKIVEIGLDGSLAYERERARTDHLPASQVASTGKVFWELLGVAAIDPRQRIPFARTFFVAAEALACIVRKVRLA